MLPTLIIQQKIHIIRGKYDSLRSQFATLKSERGQHSKYMTYVNTPIKQFLTFLFLLFYTVAYAQQDSVTIRGQVTNYEGQPIDSCSVMWQDPSFNDVVTVQTDKEGYYTARIPKGYYQSMGAIRMDTYPHTAAKNFPEADQRLEFWAWNFIADRDTTLHIRYHRMEVYGLHAFQIAGGMPTYQLFVRPMSLTRYQQWMKQGKEAIHGQDLSRIQQTAVDEQAQATTLAPPADQLKATVWIDNEEVSVLMVQEIKEYYSSDEYGNAYLLTVDRPKHDTTLPYHIFKVELEDLENGDRGEGIYYMEKETYIKQ